MILNLRVAKNRKTKNLTFVKTKRSEDGAEVEDDSNS